MSDQILTLYGNGHAVMRVFGEIGRDITSEQVDAVAPALARAQSLTVLIDSNGGCIRVTRKLVAILRQFMTAEAIVLGRCYSAAMDLVRHCMSVTAVDGATFMLHRAQSVDPDFNQEDRDQLVPDYSRWLAPKFEARSHLCPTSQQIAAWIDNETWFTAMEAMAYLNVNRIIDPSPEYPLRTAVSLAGKNRPLPETPFVRFAPQRAFVPKAAPVIVPSDVTATVPAIMPKPHALRPIAYALAPSLREALKKEPRFRLDLRNDSNSLEIGVYGEVGATEEGGVSSASVAQILRHNRGRPVTVRINSPGGSAFDGIAIFNMLIAHDGPVTVIIEGMAGSSASIIAMAGKPIQFYANASLFVHRASLMAIGNRDVMSDAVTVLDSVDDQIAMTYEARSGRPKSLFSKLMRGKVDGTTLSAAEAKQLGLCDEILSITPKRTTAIASEVQRARSERLQRQLDLSSSV